MEPWSVPVVSSHVTVPTEVSSLYQLHTTQHSEKCGASQTFQWPQTIKGPTKKDNSVAEVIELLKKALRQK